MNRCWIQGNVGNTEAEVWRWFCFYLPLWGAIGYMIFVYYNVWSELKPASSNTSTQNVNPNLNNAPNSTEIVNQPSDDNIHESNSNIMNDNAVAGSSEQTTMQQQNSTSNVGSSGNNNNSKGGALQRIKYYPVVLFVCYFFATVRRLDELITSTDAPFWMAAIQVFMSALLGTGNACVYGLSPVIRQRDMQYIRKLMGKEEAPTKYVFCFAFVFCLLFIVCCVICNCYVFWRLLYSHHLHVQEIFIRQYQCWKTYPFPPINDPMVMIYIF